ncbi:choice-of-anchor J domain-containing protein [Bacteroides sp. 51]|uniref:choice-of-anchor J domain-containing protein n=1 Tax=Bacteroides sp. 51 TaxID=2302938 RepID=UPI0013D7B276|nr:choice-of-anchor J domain-containing protein [Bacteroides sp. 51]NDV82969.1 DUF5017 domain-containing protein [Bacteroides sp. 51]
MKKSLFISISALLLLFGCDYNDKYFDGLDEMSQPKDVFSKQYTLLEGDYKTIADNKANIAMAAAEGVSTQLKNLATDKYFTGALDPKKYIPAFLLGKYIAADDGSVVKVAYDYRGDIKDYMPDLNATTIYKLSASDYQLAWGADSKLNFFTPSKPAADYLVAILNDNMKDAVEGDIVAASYNVSEKEPADVTYAFNEDFEAGTANTNIESENWLNITVKGKFKWQTKSYNGKYAQQSANAHSDGVLDSYLISKEITVESGMSLTFDAAYAYHNEIGGRVSVLITTDLSDATPEGIAAAKWDDVTDEFKVPTATSGSIDASNAGSTSLSSYVGKKIRVAFRYQGDSTTGATSTYRLDNVIISTPGKNTYSTVNTLYTYNGAGWALYAESNVIMLGQADIVEMGGRYDDFSSSLNPDNYLPTFLKRKYPYALEGDVKIVVYKYFSSSVTTIRADKYEYKNGQFVREAAMSQFAYADGTWKFDPSTVITLSTSKSDTETALFYQTITDWVKENHPSYVTSYGNNDYYYGGSAYNNNFDFRVSAWKPYYANETEEQLQTLMFERLPESFPHALKVLYADADAVAGVEVVYTINFSIYNGTTTDPYTIKYLVTGKAQFEYIKDSVKKVE